MPSYCYIEFIKLLDEMDPAVKFDDNLSDSNEYLDQKIKHFLNNNKPKSKLPRTAL